MYKDYDLRMNEIQKKTHPHSWVSTSERLLPKCGDGPSSHRRENQDVCIIVPIPVGASTDIHLTKIKRKSLELDRNFCHIYSLLMERRPLTPRSPWCDELSDIVEVLGLSY